MCSDFLRSGIVLLLIILTVAGCEEKDHIRLFMIGDSTMAIKKDPDKNPERGWGQYVERYFTSRVSVHNHAVNGRSTRSFIDEGRWAVVRDSLELGDYVVIQFAHNDEKDEDPKRYTNPYTAYRRNLITFVQDARDKGAIPILVSPIVRRKFSEEGVLQDTHGVYPFVMREVSTGYAVPFIDLQLMTEDLLISLGDEKSRSLFMWLEPGEYEMFPDGRQDDTHFVEEGANKIAGLFVEGLRNTDLDELKRFLK